MNLKLFLIIFAIFAQGICVFAGPAKQGLSKIKQPDGTEFTAVLYGDENMRIFMTDKGEAIIQGEDGYFYYACYDGNGNKSSSGYRVGTDVPAQAIALSRHIPYDILERNAAEARIGMTFRKQPASCRALSMNAGGIEEKQKKSLVILVQFPNLKFSYGREQFEKKLNLEGYDFEGATGSAKDYLDSQFNGMVSFIFDVSDTLTVSRNFEYYGKNNEKGTDGNVYEMIKEACLLADKTIDFSIYDEDGDGYVDNVFFYYAGPDESQLAGENHIWAHSNFLHNIGTPVSADGVKIDLYACCSELKTIQGINSLNGIGAFCHEFSHTLGLVDFYDTDNEQSGGISACLWGSTSIMDRGSFNNMGNTPPNYNAIEREMLGISEPVILSEGDYRLSPLSQNGSIYRYDGKNENEYYLFENRDNSGWDAYIGGNGMLVYHIDKSGNNAGYCEPLQRNMTAAERWETNTVNSNPGHECATIKVCPGATSLSNIFFPKDEHDYFVPPYFSFWDGSYAEINILNIVREGDDILFTATKKIKPDSVSVRTFQTMAVLNWTADTEFSGPSYIRWGKNPNEMQQEEVIAGSDGTYTIIIDNLEPGQLYFAEISFNTGDETGLVARQTFLTKSYNGGYPFIFLHDVQRNEDGSFPSGCELWLHVYNCPDVEAVEWYYEGKHICSGMLNPYTLSKSGILKAVVYNKDGSKDTIMKYIYVK